LTDLGPYAVFLRIRGEFIPKDPPTSTAVRVPGLLLDANIEIDAIAFLPAGPAA
jgi:enamine deaminase RidA (YjgF/YER057c/UK114 family)